MGNKGHGVGGEEGKGKHTVMVMNCGNETLRNLSVYTNACISMAALNKNCFCLSWKESHCSCIVLELFVSKVFP